MAQKIYGSEEILPVQCINPLRDKWEVTWLLGKEDTQYAYMSEILDHKPSLEEIKSIIYTWYNNKIQEQIISGYMWKGNKVWLSLENQLNYKLSYDLASQSKDNLPTFKLGTTDAPIYYKFTSLDELKEFSLGINDYINSILEEGWKIKESVDWTPYERELDK